MRCRTCHQHGHNRASCPTEKARIENLRSTYGSDHYAVARADAKAESRKNKSCSYCNGKDHNRRNCSILTSDRSRLAAVQASYRRRYLAALCETGFVPGSVVKHHHTEWINGEDQSFETVHLVTGANFAGINFDNYGCTALESKFLGGEVPAGLSEWNLRSVKHHQIIPGFANNIRSNLSSSYRRFNREYFDIVIAPGCVETFMRSIPASFLDGTSNLENYFENKRGVFGRNHSNFASMIESYEGSSRFDWMEANANAYSAMTEDLSVLEQAIAENFDRLTR